MNRDEVEGKAEALKGKVKQGVGELTEDPDLIDEGVADEAAGNTQDAFGKARRKVGEAVQDIGKAIKRVIVALQNGTAQFLLCMSERGSARAARARREHALLRFGISVVALIAGALGVSGVAGVATNIAYVLFVIGIVLLLVHLVSGRRTLAP